MSVTIDPAIAWTVRGWLVALFGGAVVHKLRAPGEFRAALAGFGLLPRRVVGPIVALLVAAEVGVVVLLVLRPAVGGAVAASLLLAYAGVMAVALARGRHGIDCGCGGLVGHAPLQIGLVVRNLLLAAMALPLLVPVGARTLGWVDGLTVLGALGSGTALAAAVGVLLTTEPRIAELRRVEGP